MNTIQPLLVLAVLLVLARHAPAAVPSIINYQGRLTNAAGVPLPGDRAMIAKIYDSAAVGTVLYSEVLGNVTVDANGVYGFQFGGNGTGAPANLASALAASNEHWLELIVDGVALAPRQKLLAVPFALMANCLPDGTVCTSMIANGAVDFNGLSPGVMASIAAGTTTAWGGITGPISAQQDLTTALAGKVSTSTTINGLPLSGNATLTKADVGLGNVDNTPDAGKPVSTLTSAALGLKLDLTTLSTAGGASKVPKMTTAGNLVLSSTTPSGNWTGFQNSLFIGDWNGGGTRLVMMNTTGTDGASLGYNTAHDVHGGELQISAPHRIALCMGTNGALQLGLSLTNSKQYVYLQQRGSATSGTTTVPSIPLYFTSNYWNGSAATGLPNPKIQAVPDGTSGDVFLDFSNPATTPNESGGDGAATLAMRLSKHGLSLPTQTITDANAVITKPLGDARYMPVVTKRSTDQIFIQSSITPQDTGIQAVLVAGTTYRVEIYTSWTFGGTGSEGGRFHLSYSGILAPLGGTALYTGGGSIASYTGISGDTGADGFNADIIRTGVGSTQIVTAVTYTATTGGTLKLQGAQAVSGATDTVLKAGSHMIVTPLQ